MSVYKTLLEAMKDNGYFNINLDEKTLKINNKKYIEKGVILVEDELINKEDLQEYEFEDISLEPWKRVSELYEEFKLSVPDKKKYKSYFKALPYEELDLEDLVIGYPRDLAQAMLEGYILLASLVGWLIWQNEKHWFWQDQQDESLIVKKSWIERED